MKQRFQNYNPHRDAPASAVKRELLAKLLEGDLNSPVSVAAAIPQRPPDTAPQLSLAQERLWFLDQLMPGSPVFNVPMAVRISRPLDLESLQCSINEVLRRHEVFRTSFAAMEGVPTLTISPTAKVVIAVTDLTLLNEVDREAKACACVQSEALRPFDLSTAPLIRTSLIHVNPAKSIFVLTMHHIISDGNSILLFFRELSTLYEAFANDREPTLNELPIQYADYAAWQRHWLQDDLTTAQLAYWKNKLSGPLPLLDLPIDYARPPIQTHTGARVVRTLSKELTRSLTALSQHEGATLFMTLLAAFKIQLHRLSGQADIIVGSPISNRPRSETENLIGFFLNNLALRSDLSGDPSFRQVLARVRRTALDAYANQDVPFERLLEELKPERDLRRTSIFQVYFNLFSFSDRIELPGGDSISFVDGWLQSEETLSKFDLTLYAGVGEQEIKLAFVYNTDLFSRARMEEMLAQLEQLLIHAVNDPDRKIADFSLVTSNARKVLPDPIEPFPRRDFKSIPEWFSQQAQRRPQALAVSDARLSWTYGELDERINQLANHLVASGLKKGDIVAIYGHRSAGLVMAILGVLKAGAAFTILDPQYPVSRLIDCLSIAKPRGWIQLESAGLLPVEISEFIANDRDCVCRLALSARDAVIETTSAQADLSSPRAADNSNIEISADALAYISFTSGSTGKPKGVMGRHGPLTLFTSWAVEKFGLNESDRFCMLSGLAHDPLHRDVLTPLQLGGCVCIPDSELLESPERLRWWMIAQQITVANLTPAMSQLLTEGIVDEEIPSLRYSFLVGDVLTNRDVARMKKLAPSITCVNLYGSTETQRAVGHYIPSIEERHPTSGKEILPLGKGIRDVKLLVMNHRQDLCGIGEVGEIYFRSPHLAKGYLGDDVLTRERFLRNPFTKDSSDRLYRTGDLGRYLPDGNVEHAGRADRQIKIRGFRVEPAEIEAALTQHPQVREATVIALPASGSQSNSETTLVAYLVFEAGQMMDTAALRDHLSANLPQFMVPSAFVSLKSLPLTPNGKLDRAAIPPTDEIHSQRGGTYMEAQSAEERELIELWQEVMRIDRVGVNDNFFELGGHSLLAVRLFSLIEKRFGKRLPLATLFRAPTIAQLAKALETDAPKTSLVPIQPLGSQPPFFCVHAVGGNVLEYYDLARHLGEDQPFYGLQSRGLNGAPQTEIKEMAAHYLREMREVQPRGPYFIGGRSLGGVIAFEMACQLRTAGEEVPLLALLDSYPVGYEKSAGNTGAMNKSSRFIRKAHTHLSNIQSLPFIEKISYVGNKSKYGSVRIKSRLWRTIFRAYMGIGRDLPKSLRDVEEFNWLAAHRFVPQSYDGCATLFWASQDLRAKFDMIEGWKTLARAVDVIEIPGTHLDIIKEPHVTELAAKLKTCLAASQSSE